MKPLTVLTVEQQPLHKVGYDKHLSNRARCRIIRSDLFAYVLPRRLVKLGLATPLSLSYTLGTGGFASSSFDEYAHVSAVICMCNIACAIS